MLLIALKLLGGTCLGLYLARIAHAINSVETDCWAAACWLLRRVLRMLLIALKRKKRVI